jgi:phage terminase large subunit-like protein
MTLSASPSPANPPPLPTDFAWIATLPPEAQDAILTEIEKNLGERKLELYEAYPKQRDFHEAGATYRERLLMAGNRLGKTFSAGAETAMHLTGRYPDWWRGRAFHKAVQGAGACETGLLTRDGLQRILFGPPVSALGTGIVPKDAIIEAIPSKFGPADFFEMVRIRHGGGGDVQAGTSLFYQRSYDQGRARIQAMDLQFFWLDEEPDEDYYTEARTRTNLYLGPVYLTFTPLKGMSNVVKRFLLDKVPGTHFTQMSIEDALHIPKAVRDAIIASYPDHEREARVHGTPQLGEGRVFQIPEEMIAVEQFPIPAHWARIVGIDFGFEHPTAMVWLAHDRDTDTVYVYDCYRVKKQYVPVHASVIRARGVWMPVAWPQDGLNETAAGPQLAKQYRDEGINMLPEHAMLPPVSDRTHDNTQKARGSVEASVQLIVNRMLAGQFKVFRHLAPWWEEYRMYHRKKGLIVKENDDLLSATRYAIMDIARAITQPKAMKLDAGRRINWRAM